ncbi:MAG: cysteine hydrolase [Oscillospiraceae bacterium]|nr:cysteine hydrolase [Oscillospiraceae bacterium]
MNQALQEWNDQLAALAAYPEGSLRDGKTALVIVDMVNGFLTEGVLSSPRSAAALPACVKLLNFAKENGIPTVAFADCHEPDCIEFASFPPHCIRGTSESEIAPALQAIGGYELIEKNSTNGFLTPAFQAWLAANPDIERIVVCGVCTDICVMQFCLTLKTFCNQSERSMTVLLPVDAVETYDAPGHNADLCGAMALQFMQQAGITLTKEVAYDD